MADGGKAGGGKEGSKVVKTSIDALMEFIRSKGTSIDVDDAATALGIPPQIAEQWAKVLEEANLVKISYKVGKMFVESVSLSPENSKIVTAKIATKRDMLEEEVSLQFKQLDKIGDIIDAAKISASNAEAVFKKKAPEMQQRLNELNKVYENVRAQYKYIEYASKKVGETNDKVNKALTAMLSKIEAYSSTDMVKNIEEIQKKINESAKSASEVNGELSTILKEKDKAIDDIRKNLNAQIESLKKQLDDAFKEINGNIRVSVEQIREEEKSIAAQEAALKDAMQSMAQFNKEKAAYEKEINAARVYFNDQYALRKQEIEKNISVFEAELKEFNARINEMKNAFGDVANIFDTINGAKKDLTEASNKLAEAKKEAANLYDMIKALSAAEGIAPEKRIDELDKLTTRSRDLNDKINSISSDITKAAGRIKSNADKGKGDQNA